MQTVIVPMETLSQIIELQLENGGKANLTVTGNSMRPMLVSHRDAVTLIPLSELQSGDIVLYKRASGAYVLHRIIGKMEEGYICCGDNQTVRELVSGEQMIAVVDGFVRNGRSYTVEAPIYKLYAAVWMRMFPLRRFYFKCRRFLGRVRRKLRCLQ